MQDLRVAMRGKDQVGNNILDMMLFANCNPNEYYAQATDKYLNNNPIIRGQYNGYVVGFGTKWFNFITGAIFFYNEVNDNSERGWYDEEGNKNGE